MRRNSWIVLALAVAFCACEELPPVNEPEEAKGQEEEEEGLPPVDETAAPALISAEIPAQIGTKVSLSPVGDGLSLAWEAGDALRVIPGDFSTSLEMTGEEFSIVEEGMTPSKAGFSGKAVSGNTFTILYPGVIMCRQM